ncbi:transcription factor GTE1 isoform X2 [Neltuma alba]|uniref:transcription factor GTE1 isoform X2 n=1 Tax=Neltuma alba TaxID=207710 RepID=UPI0010A38745|nr:transcription factor GTE1-like isoform X2 [Prosopis alba]
MELRVASDPSLTKESLCDDQRVAANMEDFRLSLDEILATVDKIEKQVNEVEQFYQSTSNVQTSGNSKGSSLIKDKGREKHFISAEKQQQNALRRAAAAAKRMQELMRLFSTILRQITQHRWAWPFLEPVDVKGLELHDYYEVIEKPMDFSTIKSKMEAKDGTGYKNVREIYADVRLVFKNAMKYNDEKNEFHVMAKSLLEKFEEKWLQLLPKVAEEEKRLQEEEAEAHSDMQLAREATYANMARDLSFELFEVDKNLKTLKQTVIQKCRFGPIITLPQRSFILSSRWILEDCIWTALIFFHVLVTASVFWKLTSEEKRILGTALAKLSPEDIGRALEIVAENNPNFQATAREVDLDIDAQSDYTLWRLKVFVKDALEVHEKTTADTAFNNNDITEDKKNSFKRKRDPCDAQAKTNVKRTKKLSIL